MLDSLVRVSRRGKEDHFVRVGQMCSSAQAAAGHGPVSDASTLPPGPASPAATELTLTRQICRLAPAEPTLVSFGSLSAISSTFDSLFKVLFIFPSRYLFAIGLPPIFSFRWNLPPTLSCNPKQLDSSRADRTPGWISQPQTGLSPSMTASSKTLELRAWLVSSL